MLSEILKPTSTAVTPGLRSHCLRTLSSAAIASSTRSADGLLGMLPPLYDRTSSVRRPLPSFGSRSARPRLDPETRNAVGQRVQLHRSAGLGSDGVWVDQHDDADLRRGEPLGVPKQPNEGADHAW